MYVIHIDLNVTEGGVGGGERDGHDGGGAAARDRGPAQVAVRERARVVREGGRRAAAERDAEREVDAALLAQVPLGEGQQPDVLAAAQILQVAPEADQDRRRVEVRDAARRLVCS